MERHLLEDEGRRLRPPALEAGRAGIVVQGDAADAPEIQTMLWIASSLLHRLAGIVGELILCVPEGARATAPWAARHPRLRDALEKSLDCGAGGCPVRFVHDMREERLDAAVLLGPGDGARTRAPFETRADCSGWLARVWGTAGPPPRPPAGTRGADGRNPFGAAAAACLAAGEVFKSMRGLNHGVSRIAEPLCLSTYDLQTRGAQEGRPANPDLPARIDAGRLAVCGAGAVAHSFCQALGLTGGLEADLLIVDRMRNYSMGDETIEQSNLARYVMATGRDLGRPKAEVLCERARGMGLRAESSDDGIEAVAGRGGLSGTEHAVSCVDNNRARHAIQGLLPRTIRGGSVYDLCSRVSVYDLAGGTACLRCENPIEPEESDRDVVERLRGMDPAAVRREAGRAGVDAGDIARHLASPSCGSLSAESLRRLATPPPDQFSANFATMLSGVVLAAEAVKAACVPGLRPALDGRPHTDAFYSFWNNRCRLSRTAPVQGCWCSAGNETPRDVHGSVWGRGGAGGKGAARAAPNGRGGASGGAGAGAGAN